jgi:hypothetical protein
MVEESYPSSEDASTMGTKAQAREDTGLHRLSQLSFATQVLDTTVPCKASLSELLRA